MMIGGREKEAEAENWFGLFFVQKKIE